MVGIYKITNPKGKVYIGQSVNIEKRWKCYYKLKDKSKFRSRIHESINKYGVDFHKFEIIEECLIEQLNERERYWQDQYDVLGINGLNLILTTCNSLSGYFSDETKRRITESKTGHSMYNEEWKNKISEGNKGKKRTEEMKLAMNHPKPKGFGEKLSKILKGKINNGKKFSQETKNKMREAHLGNKKSEEHCKNISKAKKGKPLHKDGKSHSLYYTDEIRKKISDSRTNKKPILCIENNKSFISIQEASSEMNISWNSINSSCKNPGKIVKGYSFKYI